MNTFLTTYRLALTPLSPIHIGCGEDFEPTNYVIDEGILYGFDPSRAALNDLQQKELATAVASASLLSIQRFFKKYAKTFQVHADVLIPVAEGVAQHYAEKVGKVANHEGNGGQVFNQLALERAISTGARRQPFIPGTSLKGALRTAILDSLNAGNAPQDVEYKRNRDTNKGEARSTTAMEKRLMGGDFEASPLRLLKVADLMPTGEVASRIQYSVNQKRREVKDRSGMLTKAKGPSARKECIQPGQFRLFQSDVSVPSLSPHEGLKDQKGKTLASSRPVDLRQVAIDTNAYNLPRFFSELDQMSQRGFVNLDWQRDTGNLLGGEMKQKLALGDAFLVRLGRYGGADSKTLSGDGVAHIKIMGARGEPPTFQGTTKTVWLAAEFETDQKHLLPFGWAIVEIDPQEGDSAELKAWCAQQAKGRPDMAKIRQQFEVEKQTAFKLKAELAAQVAQREAAKKAEQLAAEHRAQALATMSEQGKQIETLRQACENWATRIASSNYKKQVADTGKAGLFQDANKLITLALASAEWTAHDKQILAAMVEEWLPKVVAPWDKDQRKKLKLIALKGQ
jgi:CRISPR-associated protein Csm5